MMKACVMQQSTYLQVGLLFLIRALSLLFLFAHGQVDDVCRNRLLNGTPTERRHILFSLPVCLFVQCCLFPFQLWFTDENDTVKSRL